MMNFIKKIKIFDVYLVFLTILIALPISAPILLKLGFEKPATIIYFIYSFFCHQFGARSIHIYDFQYAWCARDTGIWLAMATVAWLIKLKFIKGIKWYWVLPFMVPIALDGGLQTIFTTFNITPTGILAGFPTYVGNNFMRFITGSLFGLGLSLWMSWELFRQDNIIRDSLEKVKEQEDKIKNNGLKIAGVYASLIIVYLGMVFLWNSTGIKNRPSDPVDGIVKTTNETLFKRREDGICPTDQTDFLDLGCFYKEIFN
jgi:uncharacterized membrane protein